MDEAKAHYRRLPGRSIHLHVNTRLLLGPDHLLAVESNGFAERYKRFYFSDIQAFVIQKTNQRRWNHFWFGGGALMFGLPAASATGQAAWFVGGVAVLFLIAILLNGLRGPACRCLIRTAVQTDKLPSLTRVRTARRVLEILRPQLEQVQGAISPEETVLRIRQSLENAR